MGVSGIALFLLSLKWLLLSDEYWIWGGYRDTCKKPKELIAIHISSCYNTFTESTHDRVVASRVCENRRAGIHRKGGAPMTAFEIISIFIGILALLMSFGSLIVALLAFLDKRNNKRK